jgi:hypothetical protein
MGKLLKILTVHSVKDLFKFKSFFFLIFLIIIFDRVIHRYIDTHRFGSVFTGFQKISGHLDNFVFEALPDLIVNRILDYRIAVAAVTLFFFKQIISMWPSSDMRRMHRDERKGFGILGSLISLRWGQILWDAAAVATICGFATGWALVVFYLNHFFRRLYPSFFWVWMLGLLLVFAVPILFAGFSYSSKLAVISRGSFGGKLKLFFKIFTDRRIFIFSYVFFLIRLFIESVFIGIIPAYIIIHIDDFWLRITLASLLITPVYSYLKMASFKFFLSIYMEFPEVHQEYRHYYAKV